MSRFLLNNCKTILRTSNRNEYRQICRTLTLKQVIKPEKGDILPAKKKKQFVESKAKPVRETLNPKTFENLLRNSLFVEIGNPKGKTVRGTIVEIVKDDLYIDFGFKFLGICKVPFANAKLYKKFETVMVRINDLEISDRFLGSSQDMTLLEADITLMGLEKPPAGISYERNPFRKLSDYKAPKTLLKKGPDNGDVLEKESDNKDVLEKNTEKPDPNTIKS